MSEKDKFARVEKAKATREKNMKARIEAHKMLELSKLEETKDKNKKARYWTFVCYPDSLPNDWISIINQMGVEWCLSPLHDKDMNEDGTPKKAHYHVLLSFGNTTTYNSVKDITEQLNSPIPQIVKNPKGMIRYFMHLDNPDKYQYSKDEIKSYNGFDFEDYLKVSTTQELIMQFEIISFIEDNFITSYLELCKLCYNLNFDWYRIVATKSIFFTSILKDLRYKLK